eukprot:759660-Pyramimonas_sp.AAC.1
MASQSVFRASATVSPRTSRGHFRSVSPVAAPARAALSPTDRRSAQCALGFADAWAAAFALASPLYATELEYALCPSSIHVPDRVSRAKRTGAHCDNG